MGKYDLAPYHPRLARQIAESHVIHTTDAYFAFSKTARKVSRRWGIPLVNSVHTDTPKYGRIFTAETIRRLAGNSWFSGLLLDRLHIELMTERRMCSRLAAYQRNCDFSLVSRPDDLAPLADLVGPNRYGLMRRGIDCRLFDPAHRDRRWLESRFGVSEDSVVVLFVGRVNIGKDVMTLAAAVRDLADQGVPIHLICAGEGEQIPEVLAMLGAVASCPGILSPEVLARLYASSDVFATPSRIEVFSNVVLEAMASGLPILVCSDSGMARVLRDGEAGFIVAGGDPRAWSGAVKRLALDSGLRDAMGKAARQSALRDIPSWDDVLLQDLLPVWQRVVAGRKR
ncbi:MAG: glycosyltransferase [Rhodospirillaceae bacterium]